MTTKQELEKALEAVGYCLKTIKTRIISPDENAIWSTGSSKDPRITEEVLSICRHVLTQALREAKDD